MDSGGNADDNKEEEESSMLRSFFCCCIVFSVVSLVRIRRGSGDGKKVTTATTSMAERTRKAQCVCICFVDSLVGSWPLFRPRPSGGEKESHCHSGEAGWKRRPGCC